MAEDVGTLKIRKAVIGDVGKIQKLVNQLAAGGAMLALPLSQIYEQIRDFLVAEDKGGVVGVCALHVIWEDLGEIRSLAVDPCCRDAGIGRSLVERILDEARDLHLRRVFALTYQEDFFQRLGFAVIDKGQLPHKVWGDCLKCTKFPDCDETAVMLELDGAQ